MGKEALWFCKKAAAAVMAFITAAVFIFKE
jgi:hypothetical protein